MEKQYFMESRSLMRVVFSAIYQELFHDDAKEIVTQQTLKKKNARAMNKTNSISYEKHCSFSIFH